MTDPGRFEHSSAFVVRCLERLSNLGVRRVLDAPCGYGRHTLLALREGHEVHAIDRDAARVSSLERRIASNGWRSRATVQVDDLSRLDEIALPSYDVVVVTDYVDLSVLAYLATRLPPGGHVVFETFQARGENWVDLPPVGSVAACFAPTCDMLIHQERPVQQSGNERATVKVLARRR